MTPAEATAAASAKPPKSIRLLRGGLYEDDPKSTSGLFKVGDTGRALDYRASPRPALRVDFGAKGIVFVPLADAEVVT